MIPPLEENIEEDEDIVEEVTRELKPRKRVDTKTGGHVSRPPPIFRFLTKKVVEGPQGPDDTADSDSTSTSSSSSSELSDDSEDPQKLVQVNTPSIFLIDWSEAYAICPTFKNIWEAMTSGKDPWPPKCKLINEKIYQKEKLWGMDFKLWLPTT